MEFLRIGTLGLRTEVGASEGEMKESKSSQHPSPSRRGLLKTLSLLPAVAAPLSSAIAAPSAVPAYVPSFFSASEWTFVVAACDRLIPHDAVGPGAVELGVPEFLDRHMQTPYACGDIWYMQGPFLKAAPEFGYQGRLALRDILRVGIANVDRHCRANFAGRAFAELEGERQDQVLRDLETAKIGLDDVPSRTFFVSLLSEVRNGYFSDPKHGGNRGMGSWKMIGYPGMRADFHDWVEVRDRPYPLSPVDLAGRRA